MRDRHPLARLLLAAALAGTVVPALAEDGIYKSRDAQGNVIYTDEAPDGTAEPVTLPRTNTMQEMAPAAPKTVPAAEEEARPAYDSLDIVSPADGESLFDPIGNLEVGVAVSPPLAPGHSLQVLLDGVPAGFADGGTLLLQGVSRGPHTLQVQVLGADGETLQSSGTISVQLQRAPTQPRVGPVRIPVPH